MERRPAAFLSYARFNDQHDDGRITELRERLEGEVRVHTGEDFPIFQDRADIRWGQEWQARIDGAIDAATLFIPVLTPGFLRSAPCRLELEAFLAREKNLGRGDLILPIYYVDTPLFNDPARRASDLLATALYARQYVDWRDLRLEPITDPQVGRRLATLAVQIRDVVDGVGDGFSVVRPSEAKAGSVGASTQGNGESRAAESPPKAKNEPPTHVVDSWGRGDFLTISAAIQAAKVGDRILVRPGFYAERLVITKPLEIVGDGPAEEILVQPKEGTAVSFFSSVGRISNLTLRGAGGYFFCVDISEGRLHLDECNISSIGEASIVAIREGASPTLRRNRIHDGNGSGVYIFKSGEGLLEENEIFGNAGYGVSIKGGAKPILRRNKITGNSFAIMVHEKSGGTFEENDLRLNARGAWNVSRDSERLVTRRNNQE